MLNRNINISLILLFALNFILISCKDPNDSERKGACYNCSDGRGGSERDWKMNGLNKDFSLPLLSINERVIGVLITDKNVIVSKLQVFHKNNFVEIDTNIQPSYKEIFVEELVGRQLYNPETRSLWFYQTINPINGDLNDSIHMKIQLNDGIEVTNGTLVG